MPPGGWRENRRVRNNRQGAKTRSQKLMKLTARRPMVFLKSLSWRSLSLCILAVFGGLSDFGDGDENRSSQSVIRRGS